MAASCASPIWNPDIDELTSLLAAPGILADGIGGNVASSFEVSPDGQVFTLMREGIKWSDGVPVTTEDVRFTYRTSCSTTSLPRCSRAGCARRASRTVNR